MNRAQAIEAAAIKAVDALQFSSEIEGTGVALLFNPGAAHSARNALAYALAMPADETCKWTYISGEWHTECGHVEARHCPMCGRRVEIVRESDGR